MGVTLNKAQQIAVEKTKQQSINTYRQHAKVWREHAAENARHKMKSLNDFLNVGIGRVIVCVANGYSFEENSEILKQYHAGVDIMCCDKTLGHLLNMGIKPTYCLVCDAGVDYEKFLKPFEDQLSETYLLMNVCANPEWADHGNWKDKYFFVNRDVMNYEKEFMAISKCPNAIPAGTNVSNGMVVMLFQGDSKAKRNHFNYDKVLLIGYDYSWRPDGKYYAFDDTGLGGKNNYMRHITCVNLDGELCFTSNNLHYSAEWLTNYVNVFKYPVIQCSKDTIYPGLKTGDLSEQMKYRYKPEDAATIKKLVRKKREYSQKLAEVENTAKMICVDHWRAVRASI